MAKTIETKVYEFDELSDDAKEKAREWYREGNEGDSFWSESVIEEGVEAIEACGVDLDTHEVQLMGGGKRREPTIYWSGFSSQGDGLTFTGRVSLKEWMQSQKLAGKYRTLYNAACGFGIAVRIDRQHYYGSDTSWNAMYATVEVNDYPNDHAACERLDEQANTVQTLLTEWAQAQARELYKNLSDEWDYVNSDEQVDDGIRANEYTFTKSGKRFG